MSKVLKTAALVVGAAALIATGAGAIFGAAAVTAALGGISAVALTAAATVLSLGASLLTKPKPAKISDSNHDRLNISINVRRARVIAFGHTALDTDLRDQEFTGADKEFLHRFVVNAAHKIGGHEEIWFDDQLAWSSTSGVQAKYAGYLTVTPISEGTPANAINISARMGSSRRFTGCAYVYMKFKLTGNSKKTDSPFSQQVPTRVTIIGKGIPCYDPRQDSTVPGGSGALRADDQTTWTYGEHAQNPACQYATYLLGWRIQNPQSGTWKLSVGCGTPPDRIDWPSFIDAANLCDEPVALAAGGTEPRYRGAGLFDENDDPTQVTEAFKAAMNADVDDQDGLIRLTVFHNDLSTSDADFTESDIQGDDWQWLQTQLLNESFNVVRGSYIEPDDKSLYQPNDYKAAELPARDGIERVHPADFGLVQSKSQAERLAKQLLQRQQYGGTFKATFLAAGWKVQKNSVVRLSFAPEGFVNKLFRVAEIEVREDGLVPMTLREENADLYAWDAEESPAVVIADPTLYEPGDTPLAQAITDLDATVDGKVTTFFQSAVPTAEGIGDLWFRSSTGKWYRAASAGADAIASGEWELTEDSGIGDAIEAAAGAQATADGKIETFFVDATPTASGVGDLWVRPSDTPRVVKRWSGSAWVAVNSTDLGDFTGDLDDIDDGGSFARLPTATSVGTGTERRALVDLSQSHLNKKLDFIDDGTTYSRTLASRLNSGRPTIDFSETIHANKNLASLDPAAREALFTPGANLIFNGSLRLTDGSGWALGWSQGPGWTIETNRDGIFAFHDGDAATASVCQSDPFPVTGNANFRLDLEMASGGITAGNIRADVRWYSDTAGTVLISTSPIVTIGNGLGFTPAGAVLTSPATAIRGRVRFYLTAGTTNSSAAIRRIKQSLGAEQTPFSDEATNSVVALTKPGTGITIGDGRNLLPIQSVGGRFVYTGAITYTSSPTSATINVAAGNLLFGSVSVSYNGMSVNVSGSASTTKRFFLYVNANAYVAGNHTLLATDNTDNIANADGIAQIGYCDVAFPASGSGGGNGGGAGGVIGGDCVGEEMWLLTDQGRKRAIDIEPGDLIWALSEDLQSPRWVEVEENRPAFEPWYRLKSERGAELLCSASTPLTLRDGSYVFPPDVPSAELPVEIAGADRRWELVTIAFAGMGRVRRIVCGGAVYAAGADPEALIFTHNPIK